MFFAFRHKLNDIKNLFIDMLLFSLRIIACLTVCAYFFTNKVIYLRKLFEII